jgi:hypothetical protein
LDKEDVVGREVFVGNAQFGLFGRGGRGGGGCGSGSVGCLGCDVSVILMGATGRRCA